VDDAWAALTFLRERYPALPFALAGFSFGSRVILRLGCAMPPPRPARLIPVGFPTTLGQYDYLNSCELPKYFVQSTQDVHGPRLTLEKAFDTFAEPKSLQFIEAKDHFFDGALDQLEDAIATLPR
jgi:alpha/beta superfamily hydrolase